MSMLPATCTWDCPPSNMPAYVVHLSLQQQFMHLHVYPYGICSVAARLADEEVVHRQQTTHSIFHALCGHP